eukprot:10538536-Prorocentrum_lima.AAC.1
MQEVAQKAADYLAFERWGLDGPIPPQPAGRLLCINSSYKQLELDLSEHKIAISLLKTNESPGLDTVSSEVILHLGNTHHH